MSLADGAASEDEVAPRIAGFYKYMLSLRLPGAKYEGSANKDRLLRGPLRRNTLFACECLLIWRCRQRRFVQLLRRLGCKVKVKKSTFLIIKRSRRRRRTPWCLLAPPAARNASTPRPASDTGRRSSAPGGDRRMRPAFSYHLSLKASKRLATSMP